MMFAIGVLVGITIVIALGAWLYRSGKRDRIVDDARVAAGLDAPPCDVYSERCERCARRFAYSRWCADFLRRQNGGRVPRVRS